MDPYIYKDNIKVLEKRYPEILRKLKRGNPLPLIKIKGNQYTVKYPDSKGVYLNSRYQPYREALRIIENSKIKKEDIVILFGIGLGYLLSILHNNFQNIIFAIEPDINLFYTLITSRDIRNILLSPRIKLIVGKDLKEVKDELSTNFKNISPKSLKIVEHKILTQIYQDYFIKLTDFLNSVYYRSFYKRDIKLKILISTGRGIITPYILEDCKNAFEELGHQVIFIKFFNYSKDISEKKIILDNIKRYKPDLVFSIDDLGTCEELFNYNIPIVTWYTDDPSLFKRRRAFSPKPNYVVFIWDRSYQDILFNEGFKNIFWLPHATNPHIFKKINLPKEVKERFSAEVNFVGSSADIHRRSIISKINASKVDIFGDEGWKSLENPNIVYRGRIDYKKELPLLYNASKINLNVNVSQMKNSSNNRVFDIPACKAFLLTDYKEDLEELFQIDEEIIVYRDVPQLNELITYYLNHGEERRRIAEKAQKKVLSKHTYIHRMQRVLEICFSL
jgi:spore maturation protein CgeB